MDEGDVVERGNQEGKESKVHLSCFQINALLLNTTISDYNEGGMSLLLFVSYYLFRSKRHVTILDPFWPVKHSQSSFMNFVRCF